MRDFIYSWVTNLSGLSHSLGVPHLHVNRGPFLKSPGNFSGPKSNIQIEIKKKIIARVLASKLLHFVSLTDGFILLHKTVKTKGKIRRFGVVMTPLSRNNVSDHANYNI